MTDTEPVHPSRIERQFEEVIDNDKHNLPLVQDVLDESHDRWYGQLVVIVYDSLSDHQDVEEVLPYAAAIELLQGYVRLRNRLLITLSDKHAHSFTEDTRAALLASDYLYTAAFSSLRLGPDSSSSECFKILIAVLETITETFARTYTATRSTDYSQAKFLDEVAGSLGEGAAALGARAAGVDESVRRHCKRLGRGLSTVQQINYVLNMHPTEAMVVPPTLDDLQFRKYTQQRRNDATQALNTLSKTVDVTHLQAFADVSVTRHHQQSSVANDDVPN